MLQMLLACAPVGGMTLFEKTHTHWLGGRQMRRNMFHSVKTNKSSDGAALLSALFPPPPPPPPPPKKKCVETSRRVFLMSTKHGGNIWWHLAGLGAWGGQGGLVG